MKHIVLMVQWLLEIIPDLLEVGRNLWTSLYTVRTVSAKFSVPDIIMLGPIVYISSCTRQKGQSRNRQDYCHRLYRYI